MNAYHQKGMSLIIIFIIMTLSLSMVLSVSTVVISNMKLSYSKGNVISSFYAAESGIEKTLYFDKKKIPKKGKNKGTRGLCNICNECQDCQECVATALSYNGCDPITCSDCRITYYSAFNDRMFAVEANVAPSLFLSCSSEGEYKDAKKVIEISSDGYE